jgi:two-component system, sensor histidine kinase and response regulator
MKHRLLIVDDEPDMLDFMERVFRSQYEVVRASSGDEALRLLGQKKFAVVITDQKMPQMTGVELLERIGQRLPYLVKVLLSGFTDVPEIERAMDRAGIHNYVVKPIDSEKLRAAVKEAIERHARGRALSDSQARRTKVES